MRFGTCIDLVADEKNGFARAEAAAKAGVDFFEANLTSVAGASRATLDAVKAMAAARRVAIPVANGMFPREIRLTGPQVVPAQVRAYVERAFHNADHLGIRAVVLGSDKSRQLPEGYDPDLAYAEFSDLIAAQIVPVGEKYGIVTMVEPLRRPCNFINTLAEGMRIVTRVNHPLVKLLADTIHIITSGEDVRYVHRIKDAIWHVHVSDWERALPEYGYSSELCAILRELQAAGYDGDYSFEASPGKTEHSLQRALLLLKQRLGVKRHPRGA